MGTGSSERYLTMGDTGVPYTYSNPLMLFRELQDRYTNELLNYLARPGEPPLRRAHQLGRTALNDGLSVLEMAAIHHESMRMFLLRTLEAEPQGSRERPSDALVQLLHSLTPAESTAAVSAAGVFFAESLSPFERGHREIRQANAALHRRNLKLEEQALQVAHALYDETLQLVAALHLALAQIAPEVPAAKLQHLAEARGFLELIESQLAAFSNELRPNILDNIGLPAALEAVSRSVSGLEGIEITVDTSTLGAISPLIGITLYHAVQEALANVIRHANARQVTIRVRQEDGVIICSVRDNGIGFDAFETLEVRGQPGLGLIGIRESLRILGGTLTINSSVGSGTELLIHVRQNN
jgi:signal transduction histidine kinase